MAKITGTIRKVSFHQIEIDTDDYIDNDPTLGEVFDFYQAVKDDPMEYAEDAVGRPEIELTLIEIN